MEEDDVPPYGASLRLPTFDELLGHALASDEIAVPALELGVTPERLAAMVSPERANQLVAVQWAAWDQLATDLGRARFAVEVEQHVRNKWSARARLALLRALPGRGRLAEAVVHARDEQVALIRADTGLDRLEQGERDARHDYVDTLYEQGIMRPLRAFVDERLDRSWSTVLTLSADDAPGLAELRSSPPMPLAAIEDVDDLMDRMPGGSIGISGPRGVGKTTLIRWFAQTRAVPRAIGAYVSAPTRYDARDFVLHLFATLCSAVLADGDEGQRASRYWPRSVRATLARWLVTPPSASFALLLAGGGLILASLLHAHVDARLLAGLGCLAVATAIGLSLFAQALMTTDSFYMYMRRRFFRALVLWLVATGSGLALLSQLALHTPLWAWGVLGIGLALGLGLAGSAWPRFMPTPAIDDAYSLRERARAELEGIHFQMTLSSGWNGTLKLPFAEGGLAGGRSFARRPVTLPELTAVVEDFIRDIARFRRVVIGIDELDKMESEQAAHQFLNEIKGVFGIRDCFFLVSVSEEAMSNFARRDARLRDAFDSSFDEIVHVRPLNLTQSRTVLSERVIGLPVQFAALCHVLAGGLPRDLIRYARTVVALNPAGGSTSLSDVVREVVARELELRARAATIAIRDLGAHSLPTPLLAWLAGLEHAVDRLAEVCSDADVWRHALSVTEPERHRLTALILELQGFCYFALTLRDVFDQSLDRPALEALQQRGEGGSFDALAQARAACSTNPLLAWSEVSAFRRSAPLEVIDVADPRIPADGR
jgi:nucleoside-triphosphatase THEP1